MLLFVNVGFLRKYKKKYIIITIILFLYLRKGFNYRGFWPTLTVIIITVIVLYCIRL